MFGKFESKTLEAKSIVIYQKDVPPGSDPPLIDSQASDEPEMDGKACRFLWIQII